VAKKQKLRSSAKKRPGKRNAVTATRRSTAGTGFDFEDYVAGWYLLQALAGRALTIEGALQRLQMQTGSLLWDIDDLLVTTQDATATRRLAISCKGSVQVSANGLPESFAALAWRLWTNADSPFNRAADRLALATQGTHEEFQSAWSDVTKFAAGDDTALALGQIAANARYKKIFDHLKPTAETEVTDADVLDLIRRIDVLPFDFQRASKDESSAIAVARSLLADGTAQTAKKLWDEIVGRARETRLGSGTLDMAALRRWLRSRFALKDLPDYEQSWTRLRALGAETESLIQGALPSGTCIDFRSDCDRLLVELGVKPCLAIYGDSGIGKSALAAAFLDAHFPGVTRIWLAPEHLEEALNEADRARFGVAHPLINVLDAAVTAENFLIIDSAERLSAPSRIKVQQLVRQLLELNGSDTPPPWRVIIIGQTESGSGRDIGIASSPASAFPLRRPRSALKKGWRSS
jgi:hypothetical protein